MRGSKVLPLAAVVLAVALAGCTGGGLSPSNFALAPNAIGWNVGDEASFTLAVEPTLFEKEPTYTVDADFAISELRLERKGPGIGGDYGTDRSSDVDLRVLANGSIVQNATLENGNASVELRLFLPESLADSEYVLELRLFSVGWVKSDEFRVNVP